jgi:RNA polymerase sigma-70 factor (ECF subfamily)
MGMEPERDVAMETVIVRDRPPARPGDIPVIDRAAHGDTVAFEQLIAPRLDQLLRTAWAIVGNEADARDAVQEACLSAWRELPRLRDIDRFDAWLGRVLVNRCRMLLRARGRVREIAMPDGFDAESPPTGGPAAVDDAELVARAFDRLDPDARALLVLHHLRHEPVARIASVLGIPIGTVKWRLHAARRALELALAGESR